MFDADAGRLCVRRRVVVPLWACLLLCGCESSDVGTIKGKGDVKPSTETLLPVPEGKTPPKGVPPLSGTSARPKGAGR